MIRSNSNSTVTTTSSTSTPLSGFSNHSVLSEPTSDEQPDLGAFTTILRELNFLHPLPRIPNSTLAFQPSSTSSRQLTSLTHEESDSDYRPRSTVWSHRPIASYLVSEDSRTGSNPHNSSHQSRTISDFDERAIGTLSDPILESSDTEGEQEPIREIDLLSELDFNDVSEDPRNNDSITEEEEGEAGDLAIDDLVAQPSLGLLDEALSFIMAERERLSALRDSAPASAPLEEKWTSSAEPRRKRRRKRNKTPRTSRMVTSPPATPGTNPTTTPRALQRTNADDDDDDYDHDDDSSSSNEYHNATSNTFSSSDYKFQSIPATPARRRVKASRRKDWGDPVYVHGMGLRNSRSTPQLRTASDPKGKKKSLAAAVENPRARTLLALAKRLVALYPQDKEALGKVRFESLPPTNRPLLGSPSETGGPAILDPTILGSFVDTRGPLPSGESNERLIHVFVDHSNILFGLLNYLKKYPKNHPQYRSSGVSLEQPQPISHGQAKALAKPPKHLSHSALTLIMERGRPVTRRVLVTSSPLYQPMDSAQQLGFEVRVFARVPDTGDGMDREASRNKFRPKHGRSLSGGSSALIPSPAPRPSRRRSGSASNVNGRPIARKQHVRYMSAGASAESEQGTSGSGVSAGIPPAQVQSVRSPAAAESSTMGAISSSLPAPSPLKAARGYLPFANAPTPPDSVTRVRYREQGVDELLQLKLHQALASIDGSPPTGSTIVLATGDGNVGQFNEEGFLGSVRTALKKGWNVELYAWEGGLSRSWKREFGEGTDWGQTKNGAVPQFKVISMEQFGGELVEMYF